MKITKIKEQLSKRRGIAILIASFLISIIFATLVFAADTTQPTIVQVSPSNNQVDIATHDIVTVQFSEQMDVSTINKNTFIVTQRTTPEAGSQPSEYRSMQLDGTITYNGFTATFIPLQQNQNPLQPSQQYGNVFTVTVTNGVKDIAGNSLSQDYVWSFTTGGDSFNRGVTTSQQGQSSAIVTPIPPTNEPVIVPIQIPTELTPTTAPIAATSTFPWVWVIGILLLLLLLVLFFALTKKPERQKNIQTERPNPFGDIHPVIDLEGIGPKYSDALKSMGIKNTKQLWEADSSKVARATGASLSSVKSWQHMAELASVKDIGPQYAELLERSGIHSIKQLKNISPTKLLKLVNEKQESLKINIQGNHPGHAMVEHWIDEAREHKFTGYEGQKEEGQKV